MIDNNDVTNELNADTMEVIKNNASDKAFARLATLEIDLAQFKNDLISGSYYGITRDEVKLMIQGTKKEIQTWNYIATLIECQQNE
jgi:hypothetical protein